MSSTYRVLPGDTFELIARKAYGTEIEASRIARANPGVSEPLLPGTSVVVPDLPSAPVGRAQAAPTDTPDEVALTVQGERFRFWESIRVTRSLDAMDTLAFSAPFEPEDAAFRETFRPFTFKDAAIAIGGEPVFSGKVVGIDPTTAADRRSVSVSGYSAPAVLNDCTPPSSSYPLEFDGQGLREIASALAGPFGLAVEFSAPQGAVFERVASEPSKKILEFLVDLAKQRNLVVSSTPRGALLFQQSAEAGKPVARLAQGASPLLSVSPAFSPQQYYSHITALEAVTLGVPGSQYTVKNTHLPGVVRPLAFNAPDTLDADVKEAAQAKAGRMFGNMVAYTVAVDTWRDPQGALWQPNTTLTLVAPGAMVYAEYEFLIRSVTFEAEARARTATLTLALPGAFSGQIPEALPWDG